jgi:hypothetical protein|tara:strand:- start:266 stop:676 length:411 start_codon:yes stop_codon:yes gene_type:complete
LSLAVWCLQFGTPEPRDIYRSLPYTVAKLPVTYKHDPVRVETIDDIWDIIDEICKPNERYTDGQILFHSVPFFADCNLLLEDWMIEMINEYNYITRFNVSLGELDNISTNRLDCFTIIDNEINACTQEKAKKEANG